MLICFKFPIVCVLSADGTKLINYSSKALLWKWNVLLKRLNFLIFFYFLKKVVWKLVVLPNEIFKD